jgi:hypothetical protein
VVEQLKNCRTAAAAFRGLPINAEWSATAQDLYFEILKITNGRDIVAEAMSN